MGAYLFFAIPLLLRLGEGDKCACISVPSLLDEEPTTSKASCEFAARQERLLLTPYRTELIPQLVKPQKTPVTDRGQSSSPSSS